MPSKRLNAILKIAAELDKLAQQLRLPGIQEPQLDLPGIPLDLPSSKKDRVDLTSLDFGDLPPSLHNDIRKIINYEMVEHSSIPKEQIIDLILSRAKINVDDLLKEFVNKVPGLKANIPGAINQLRLPEMPPNIRIFPNPKEIEESKEKIEKDYEEAIKKYDEQYDTFIKQHGRNPRHYEIGIDPRRRDKGEQLGIGAKEEKPIEKSFYGQDKILRAKDVEIDLTITKGQYTSFLNRLYRKYDEVQKNYNELNDLYDKLDEIGNKNEMPPADPTRFNSYKDLVYDLRDRIIFGIHTVIKGSIGNSLFGKRAGGNSRVGKTIIFTQRQDDWYNDPEKMNEFLQEVPKVYDHKDKFWKSYGESFTANDLDYWFNQKYRYMKSYNDNLKMAKESFVKGVRFFKSAAKKLEINVEEQLNVAAFKYIEYIEESLEHKAKLNELYLDIVKQINETSKMLANTGSKYNNGLYQISGHHSYVEFDIGKMLVTSIPQYTIINSLTNLLTSSIKTVIKQINENELKPLITTLSNDISAMYIKDELHIEKTDMPTEIIQTYSGVIYADQRAMKIADAWIRFAADTKITTNFQSIVKYPEFMFKNDPERAKLLVEAMKERLGYLAASLINNKLPTIFYDKISDLVNEPKFVYRGPDKLREEVFGKKSLLFDNVRQVLNGFGDTRYFDVSKIIPSDGSSLKISQTMVPSRYTKLKGIIKEYIENVKEDSPMFKELTCQSVGFRERVAQPSLKADALSNIIVNEAITESKNYSGAGLQFIRRLLYFSALEPLKQNFYNRSVLGNVIIGLISFDYSKFANNRDGIYTKELNNKEQIDTLSEYKLPTDLSGFDFSMFTRLPIMGYQKQMVRGLLNVSDDKEISDEEYLQGFYKEVKIQEGLNKQFNDLIEMAQAKLLYKLEIDKTITTERNMAILFGKRLQVFGGVGPNAINAKFQELAKFDRYKHLPLQEMAKIDNELVVAEFKNYEDFDGDDTVCKLYKQFNDDDNKGTNLGAALAVISKALNITNAQQIMKLNERLIKILGNSSNMAREDIEYIFPALITNLDALDAQIEYAKKLAEFSHSEGEGLGKDVILSFAKNPNFKDWIKQVNAIKDFFSAYISIKRLGGTKSIVKTSAEMINQLVKNKVIKRGITRRLEIIVNAFESGTRINPGIEGFDNIKQMVASVAYDLNAIENYTAFAKYNEKSETKEPLMYKLDWNMSDKKFRFRVLKTFDPYHFQVGVDTNCCQKLGGAGEAAAIDSYINPLAGVVLLEVMVEGVYQTAGQSYFHFVPTDKGIILDNVETSKYQKKWAEITGYTIDQLYVWWALIKKDQMRLAYFICGTSYNKLENEDYEKKSLSKDPRSFKHTERYTDWKPSKSINLLAPKFKLPDEILIKKKKREKRVKALFGLFSIYKTDELELW